MVPSCSRGPNNRLFTMLPNWNATLRAQDIPPSHIIQTEGQTFVVLYVNAEHYNYLFLSLGCDPTKK